MKRDAEATRRRILDAAITEFSRYGIAGARVDRIAAAADCNKAMIYAYYTNKEGLFDAVFDAIVLHNMHEIPIDAADLPEYAARLFDQHRQNPQYLRIGTWDRLERGGAGLATSTLAEASQIKIDAIARAQSEGLITGALGPELLLELILTLSRSQAPHPDDGSTDDDHIRRRDAVKYAVASLLQRSPSAREGRGSARRPSVRSKVDLRS